jgi:hypothetical protein
MGAPNTATTASPMNFSTLPPNRSSSDRRCVVRREERAHVFRIHLLRLRGKADQVAEEHRHDLALFARGQRGGERCGTFAAELEALRVVLAASGANRHRRSVRRQTAARKGDERVGLFASGVTSVTVAVSCA